MGSPARAVVVLLTASLAAGTSLDAYAHDIDPRHSASIEVRAQEEGWIVNVGLVMEVPPAPRGRRLVAQFDLDGSGTLDPLEGRLLANSLGAETVGGFVLLVGEDAPLPDRIDGEATSDPEGRVRVSLHLVYSLDQSSEELGVRILERPGGSNVPARPVMLTVSLKNEAGRKPLFGPAMMLPGGSGSTVRLDPAWLGEVISEDQKQAPAAASDQ